MAVWTVVLVPLNYFFSATFKTFYLLHSWKRASSVVNSLSHAVATCFRFGIYTTPVVLYSAVIPATGYPVSMYTLQEGQPFTLLLSFADWTRILETTAIILVASIDLSLLICFIVHIFKHTRISETAPIERKFLVISYFGIASNVLCIIAFVAQVVQVATVVSSSRFIVRQMTLDAATHLVFTGVFLTLVVMTVVLRHEDRLEAAERETLLRKSIAKYSAASTRSVYKTRGGTGATGGAGGGDGGDRSGSMSTCMGDPTVPKQQEYKY
ncbi:hypothetical protein HDU81_003380 [Chytriomyces hyalinus]|nr:hypothetical protein HDU81_003380 [Chytriomyces hyalinus]